MGEAKRKRHDPRDTLDGGEPSDDRIVLMLDMFDPMQALLAMDDAARLTTVRECMARAHQRPTPLCSACEYEFGYGETAVYCTRPMFPKGEAFTLISGVICPRCSVRPANELMAAIVGYLRKIKPDLTIAQCGTA